MKQLLLITLVILCHNLTVFSQHLEFKNFSNDEGLSNNYVRFLYQDSYGFMWIGTNEGVDRYDGKNFISIKKELNSNIATAICQINPQIMWIGTTNGIVVYNQELRKKIYEHSIFANHGVQSIHKIADSLFCVASNKGLFLYNIITNELHTVIENQVFQSVCYNNVVYIITNSAIQSYDISSRTIRIIQMLENPAKDFKIIGVAKQSLCVSQENKGLTLYSLKSQEVKTLFRNVFHFSNSIIEYNDELWIATRNGIVVLDSVWNVKTIVYDKVNPTFKGKNVLHLFVDTQRNIWVGTEFNGINVCYNNQKKIKHFKHNIYNPQSIQDNQINAIVEISPDIFVLGSSIGLLLFDKNKEIFSKIPGFDKDVLSFCLYKDVLLFGAKEGLFVYDLQTKTIKKIERIPEITIYKIVLYDDRFLLGTWGEGLLELSQNFSEVKQFSVSNTYEKNTVFDILVLPHDELWLATFGEGIVRIKDFSNISNRNIAKFKKENKKIPANEVLVLYKTSENLIWAGVAGQGIFVYNISKDLFVKLANSMGDPFLCAVQFFEYDNMMWFNNSGITVYDKFSKVSHTFGIDYGAQSNYYNMNAGCKSQDGTILMGGINGLNVFLPQELTSFDKSECVPIISKLMIHNKEITTDDVASHGKIIHTSIEFADTLYVSYIHENIQLYVSALGVKNPEILQFSYKIGEQSDWVEMEKGQYTISLTNLKSGNFKLLLRCKDQTGDWSKQVKEIDIVMYPPFWKTTWFYTIVIVIIVLLVLFIVKMREKQLKSDKKRLEQKVEERTQEILHQKEELQLQSELLVQNNNELSRSNRMIKDSIFYAKRIQEAMLPQIDYIRSYLPHSFVLFKPRDIVSGDFYWFKEQNNLLYIVAADCTGHGVPGAFMSMIGSTLLQDIINDNVLYSPAEILCKLDTGIVDALNQSSAQDIDSPDDGMDVSVCIIHKQKQTIQIASANHTVLFFSNESYKVIEGDMYSVGGMFAGSSKKQFTNQELMYEPGMRLYFFSDGFQDQFGGPMQKKFQAYRLYSLLQNIQNESFLKQCDILNTTFDDWKGKNKQIDDVLVIGLELI